MNSLFQAFRVEVLKAWRSRIPLFTTLGFSIGPLSAGLFMVILKDPEAARSLGVISAKAQIVAGSADWETYLGVLAQMVAIGGIIVFGFAASWVFGREYSDHTLKDLLALPTPRSSIVLAKFGVVLLWCAMMTLDVLIVGILLGFLVSLPPVLPEILRQGSFTLAATAILTLALVTPAAFFACSGHGYLAPLGFTVLMVILSQLAAVLGWGEFFPWSVPALRSGAAGLEYQNLGLVSYILVLLTFFTGVAATLAWWKRADHVY